MINDQNTIFALLRLIYLFREKIKLQFIIVAFFSFITSIFDLLSVASIIPFVGSLPGISSKNQILNYSLPFLNFGNNQILFNLFLIAILVFFSSLTRVYNLYFAGKLTAKLSTLITQEVFKISFGTSFHHLSKT